MTEAEELRQEIDALRQIILDLKKQLDSEIVPYSCCMDKVFAQPPQFRKPTSNDFPEGVIL
jgi:hypothetical protein